MSRRDRFKVGDIVQKVRNCEDHPGGDIHKIGMSVTISQCDGDGLPWFDVIEDGFNDKDCIDDIEWELEIIANSPLFAALK